MSGTGSASSAKGWQRPESASLAKPSRLPSVLREMLHDRTFVIEVPQPAARPAGRAGNTPSLRVAAKGASL